MAEIRTKNPSLTFIDFPNESIRQFACKQIYRRLKVLINSIRNNVSDSSPNVIFARSEVSIIGILNILAIISLGLRKVSVVYTQYPLKNGRLHQKIWAYAIEKILRIPYFSQVYVRPDIVNIKCESLSKYSKVLAENLLMHPNFIPLALPEMNEQMYLKGRKKREQSPVEIFTTAKSERRKGLEELINIFLELKDGVPGGVKLKIVLQITSENQKRYYELLINKFQSNIDKNDIEIFINRDPFQTRKIMNESDLYVLNSRNEPASFSHLEAIALNIPVIINRDNGSSSVLTDDFGVRKIQTANELKIAIETSISHLSYQKRNIRDLRAELERNISPKEISKLWLKKSKFVE